MEFGSLPLYKVYNLATRTANKTYFNSLGPYSCAMHAASSVEFSKIDKIK